MISKGKILSFFGKQRAEIGRQVEQIDLKFEGMAALPVVDFSHKIFC